MREGGREGGRKGGRESTRKAAQEKNKRTEHECHSLTGSGEHLYVPQRIKRRTSMKEQSEPNLPTTATDHRALSRLA